MKNFRLRKSTAGRPVPLYERKKRKVTPVGSTKPKEFSPMLELIDEDNGIRYALQTIDAWLAKRVRAMFEIGQIKELDLSVLPVTVGDSVSYRTLALGTDSGPVPVFKLGKVFGVNNTFLNKAKESISAKRTQHTMEATIVALGNTIHATPRQMLGKDPSPFPEFQEKKYGSRFHMFTGPFAEAIRAKQASFNEKE